VQEVQQGRVQDLLTAAGTGLITPNPHYYSKYRAMVDFFMFGDEQKYRFRFINAVFRGRGSVDDLLSIEEFNDAWLAHVRDLVPSTDWRYIPDPQRAEIVRQLLKDRT
jgi:hypothetical protein